MGKFKRNITKRESEHTRAKRSSRQNRLGLRQKRGTKPDEHRLPDKPTFIRIENKDIRPARMLKHAPSRVPDLRCPHCDSTRMAKEGLNCCPECGYVGKPIDVRQGRKEVNNGSTQG